MSAEIRVEALELPFPPPAFVCAAWNPLGTFDSCPRCGEAMAAEHAHFRCTDCGWRDSCCD